MVHAIPHKPSLVSCNVTVSIILQAVCLYVCQQVMYQDSTSKCWYPAVIDSLCPGPRSYKISTRDGIVYRKTQSYLKPFIPQNKMSQSTHCVSPQMAQSNHMWPVKTKFKKSQVNNHTQVQASRLKRDSKPPVNPDLLVLLSVYLVHNWIYIVCYSINKCTQVCMQ